MVKRKQVQKCRCLWHLAVSSIASNILFGRVRRPKPGNLIPLVWVSLLAKLHLVVVINWWRELSTQLLFLEVSARRAIGMHNTKRHFLSLFGTKHTPHMQIPPNSSTSLVVFCSSWHFFGHQPTRLSKPKLEVDLERSFSIFGHQTSSAERSKALTNRWEPATDISVCTSFDQSRSEVSSGVGAWEVRFARLSSNTMSWGVNELWSYWIAGFVGPVSDTGCAASATVSILNNVDINWFPLVSFWNFYALYRLINLLSRYPF